MQAGRSDKDHNATSAQVSGNSVSFQLIRALTDADVENAVRKIYTSCLEEDAAKRAAMPSPQDIEDEREMVFQRIERAEVDGAQPTSVFNLYTDFELKAGARVHYSYLRARRRDALKNGLVAGEARFGESAVMPLEVPVGPSSQITEGLGAARGW